MEEMMSKGKIKNTFWTEGFGSILIAVLVALTLRWSLLEAFVIPSESMLPTLLVHDHIFVNKIIYGVRWPFTKKWITRFSNPKRGEVMVFRYPENPSVYYIKRVVGVPGDRIFYEKGDLYINDILVSKITPTGRVKAEFDWLNKEATNSVGENFSFFTHWEENIDGKPHSILLRNQQRNFSYGPYEVPKGHYFMMGDNRDNSQDSRFWREDKRFVPEANLIGRALVVWLSCEKTLPLLSFLCDPLELRWKRFFHMIK